MVQFQRPKQGNKRSCSGQREAGESKYIGKETWKNEPNGLGICFNFIVFYGFSPLYIDPQNKPCFLSHGTSSSDLCYQSNLQQKVSSWPVYCGLLFIAVPPRNTTDHFIFWSPNLHLSWENAYLKKIPS